MAQISLSKAHLAGLALTSILFGITTGTYVIIAGRFFINNSAPKSHCRIARFAVATAMFLVAGLTVAQMLRHVLDAFVHSNGEADAEAVLSRLDNPMNIIHVRTHEEILLT
jgi:hypothetical protein